MKRTNRLGWLVRISSAAILTLGLVGCSDDGDGGTPDADVGGPDACVGNGGHDDQCGNAPAVELLPEGGILRVEYLHVGNDAVTGDRVEAPLRAFMLAFQDQAFYDGEAQKPRPFLGPLVYSSDSMNCFDQSANNLFFNAHHPSVQDFADSRTYYNDVPASAPMTARAAGTVVDLADVRDEYDTGDAIQHGQMWLGSGPGSDLTRGDYHDVAAIAPQGDFPGLALEVGYDIPAGGAEYVGAAGAYLAPDFLLVQPTEEQFYAGPWFIDDSQAMTMEFSLLDGATIPDDAPTPIWFAGFASIQDYGDGVGPAPTVTHMCLGPAGRGNTNTVELPMEVLQAIPTDGAAITGIITHTAWANNDSHRFDVVAMNCDLAFYTKTPPAAQ